MIVSWFRSWFQRSTVVLILVVILATATTLGGCRPSASSPKGEEPGLSPLLARGAAGQETAVVEAVSDGDSLVLQGGERVRLLGLDAPEVGQPGADISRGYLEKLLVGKRVRLEKDQTDRDRYGRLLRYVFLDGEMVNARLVQEGYAVSRFYPPDQRYRDLLERLEKEAETARRGLWAVGALPSGDSAEGDKAPGSQAAAGKHGPAVISWREAGRYYGRTMTVEGTVVATYNSGKAIFLNFHPDWRTHFTAVIFASEARRFPAPPERHYLNRKVRVTGLIQEYRGKPEIIVRKPDQIQLVE